MYFEYRLNKLFEDASEFEEHEELDCDYVYWNKYIAEVEGWYKICRYFYYARTCEGNVYQTVSVHLLIDHPEYGQNEILFGQGGDEDEAIADFIEKGSLLYSEDFNMFHLAIAKYVDKIKY